MPSVRPAATAVWFGRFPPAGQTPVRLIGFGDAAPGVAGGTVSSLALFAVVQAFDTTGPSLSVSANPSVLWPPNRQMVDVTTQIAVTDDFDPHPRVVLVSITSNEPMAANDVDGATFGTDDRSLRLRARRRGTNTGRTYAITYRARDRRRWPRDNRQRGRARPAQSMTAGGFRWRSETLLAGRLTSSAPPARAAETPSQTSSRA